MNATLQAVLDRRTIWRETAVAAAVLLAVLAALALSWPSDLLLRQLHSWQIFHYVLGTKYFDELGYEDFYSGLVLADAEGDNVFARAGYTRDLSTYYWVPRSRVMEQARARGVRQRFTDARWRELKGDLRAIQRLRSPSRWQGPLLDRGYNPSPAWLALHHPLLNAVNVQDPRVLFFVCNLQLLLYLLTFAVAWWALGARATLIGCLWYVAYFGNWGILTGGYFSRDWFFLTVCAAALLRRHRPVAAAPLLAYAAMMRGFPALLALHPGVAVVRDLIRRRRPARRHIRFLAVLALCCLLLASLGSLTGRGFGAWLQWKDKITLHSEKHQYTDDVVGLRHLLVHDYRTWNWTPPLKAMEQANAPYAALYKVLSALLLLLTVAAMIRRQDHDGLLLGQAAVFFIFSVSRYYLSLAALLFSWTDHDDGLERSFKWLASCWLWVLLLGGYLMYAATAAAPRQLYFLLNAGLLVYHTAVVGRFLWQDLKRLRSG